MSSHAKEWGATILRLWMGLFIASMGYREFEGLGPLSFVALKSNSPEAWVELAQTAIWTVGGGALFLGIGVRAAAFLSSAAAAYFIWEKIEFQIAEILDYQLHATILALGVAIILIGPGRLSLGAMLRKSK